MNSITQDIKFKQSVVKYSLKNGVTAAQYNITYTEKRYIDGEKDMMEH